MQVHGIAGYQLMRRAGTSVFTQIRKRWPDARHIGVVAGPGNNGGDGFVIAELAKAAGLDVQVYLVGDAARIKGDAKLAWQDLLNQGVRVHNYQGQHLQQADLIVDALFGTGLDRTVSGFALQAITAMNTLGAPLVSVDIPSGLHADTGHALGACVQAALSVSFISLKQGLFTGFGKNSSASVQFDDLGVPPEVYAELAPAAHFVDLSALQARYLPPRPRDSHKGSFGRVLIVGGDVGMAGAVCLAGMAAYRSGAGLVSLATHPLHASALNASHPELIVCAVEEVSTLQKQLTKADVVVLGPGLGQSSWSRMCFDRALLTDKTSVIDADALNLCAAKTMPPGVRVFTPHPGEAARLLGVSVRDVQQDRFSACRDIAARYACTCVLKGAGSLIYSPERGMEICAGGNPGMASAGMGDCLAGLLGGLLAQGIPVHAAASLATAIHAAAGDLEALQGERGMLAGDLLSHIRKFVNGL
jgi:NAD(P)H-hydrate epimerase